MLNVRKLTKSVNLMRAPKRLGQKPPLKLKHIWAIRIRLQLAGRLRELALFNLAIDSKLRGCDLVTLRVHDICHAGKSAREPSSFSRRRNVPFSSKSLNRRASHWRPGFIMNDCLLQTICSRAG